MPKKFMRKARRAPRRRMMRRGGKSRIGINPSYTAPKNFTETIAWKDVYATSGGVGTGKAIDLTFVPTSLPVLNGILKQMYRQYCIRGVKITYRPYITQFQQASGVAAPKLYFAEDKTSAEPDGSAINIQTILTQDNVKEFTAYRNWSTYVKFPKPVLLQSTNTQNLGLGALGQVTVQSPSNRPVWLSLQQQSTLELENGLPNSGLNVPHMVGRLSIENNTGVSPVLCGKLYYKFYYSVKEQTLAVPIPQPTGETGETV